MRATAFSKERFRLLKFTTLASSSTGNAAVVSDGQTHILVDAGISARRITVGLRQLGIEPKQLSAILITHDHTDHIGGLAVLTKQNWVPIYATKPTCQTILRKAPHAQEMLQSRDPGSCIAVGGLSVQSFSVPHDAQGTVGYSIRAGETRMVLCTDLGHVPPEVVEQVKGCDLLVCEANHDEEWVRSSSYTYFLKQRVLGAYGHLSNEAGAELALTAAQSGAKYIILAHLSPENNTPAHAYGVVSERLRREGVDLEQDVHLFVAPRNEMGNPCEITHREEVSC